MQRDRLGLIQQLLGNYKCRRWSRRAVTSLCGSAAREAVFGGSGKTDRWAGSSRLSEL